MHLSKYILHFTPTILLMFCLSLGWTSSIGCSMDMIKEYSKICLNPPPINTMKISNDSKWNHEHANKKERHIHFGNKKARQLLSGFLYGKVLEDSFEDYMMFCPSAEVEYSPGHIDSVYFGFDQKADVKCMVSEETKGALWCDLKSSTNDFTGSMKVYPHYIDRILVSTMCFDDGKVGWMVWSTHDYLRIEEEIMVLDYIESIGFDPKDIVTYYEDNCPKRCM